MVVSFLLVVAACTGTADPDTTEDTSTPEGTEAPDSTDAETPSTEAPSDGEPVEITIWFARDYIPPDDFQSLLAEHNVDVTYDVRPGDDMLPTMLQMREAGESLPCMIEDDSHWVPAYIESGLIQPMTEYIATFEEEDPDLYGTVLPSTWSEGTYDGEIYHAAWTSAYDLIYYDIEKLETAGVEVPFETWNDVLEAARLVKEAFPETEHVFGTGGTSHDPLFYWLTNFGVPFDGNIPDLTSEQGLEFIAWAQALRNEELINPDYVIGENDESQGAWIGGNGAILQDGVNAGLDYMAAPDWDYGEDWLSTPMPNNEGGAQMNVPRGWSITAECEHPYEASLALRYLMDPENALPRYMLASSTPRSTAVLESPEVAEAQPYFVGPVIEAFLSVDRQLPPGTNTLQVGDVLLDLRDELLVTGTEEAPEDIAARYQPLLDELQQG